MEDHLKNKDRLDQEWEGLCAYEAEPNSTSVAADSSNMRRNRYSDILPCKICNKYLLMSSKIFFFTSRAHSKVTDLLMELPNPSSPSIRDFDSLSRGYVLLRCFNAYNIKFILCLRNMCFI